MNPSDFGSLECWRKSWKIASLTRAMKLKKQLRKPKMSILSMKCRASSTTGWAVLHRLLRMGWVYYWINTNWFPRMLWISLAEGIRGLSFHPVWFHWSHHGSSPGSSETGWKTDYLVKCICLDGSFIKPLIVIQQHKIENDLRLLGASESNWFIWYEPKGCIHPELFEE
jgi:hypothetical protein